MKLNMFNKEWAGKTVKDIQTDESRRGYVGDVGITFTDGSYCQISSGDNAMVCVFEPTV